MIKKIVILSDNREGNALMRTEHGLSVYLETDKHKFLLDTGASDAFIKNTSVLGVKLQDVDYVFISHGHSDHIGGLRYFLDINSKAKVLLSPNIRKAQYFSKRRFLHSISTPLDYSCYGNRFIEIREETLIDDFVVYGDLRFHFTIPKGNCNLFVNHGRGLVPDNFEHELVFYVDGLLFTGCAHHGILNILNSVDRKVDICLGGFHLLDPHLNESFESETELQFIAREMLDNYPDTKFYTGHCTGDNAFETMHQANENIMMFRCGMELEFDENSSDC